MSRYTALFCLILFSSNTLAWGQVGHRVTGAIAENYLDEKTRTLILELFPHTSLAEMSTFADEQRSNPSPFWQHNAGPWHYVTVPAGKTYAQAGVPAKGDAVTALRRFREIMLNPKASKKSKQLALHFTVHIIGDLHQPLHAGNGTDRGGNDVKLSWYGGDSNLHRVWDSGMIDKQQLSYTEWQTWLQRKISEEDVQSWQQTDPQVWISESTKLRDTLYPQDKNLSWDYQYQHLPTVKRRLQQAGVRIAAYLNAVFAQVETQ